LKEKRQSFSKETSIILLAGEKTDTNVMQENGNYAEERGFIYWTNLVLRINHDSWLCSEVSNI